MSRRGHFYLSAPFKITTIIDRPMVVHGSGVSRAYHAEITTVESDERIRRHHGHRYQILRMADGSEFAFPAPPSVYGREDPPPPDRAADVSLPLPLHSPSHLDDSSWIHQPLGQPTENPSYGSEAYGGRSGIQDMPIYSHDPYAVATPMNQHFREYSASDPGVQDYGEWHSVPRSRERSGSWHESGSSLEAASSAVLADAMSQTQSSYHATTNDAPTLSSARPQSVRVGTGNDESSLDPTSTPTSTTLGRNTSAPTHLLDMVSSGKYSDLKIVLDSANDTFSSRTFNVHRVIISQSPVLNEILERKTQPKGTVHLVAPNRFCLPRGFEFALQRYYGLELITKDNVYDFARASLGEASGYDLTSNMLKKAAMDLALCYGVAGAFFGQPDVVDAAFNLVLNLFDWSNFETALQFGLYPGEFLLTYDKSSSSSSSSKKRKGRRNRRIKRLSKENKRFVLNSLNGEMVEKWAPKIASTAIKVLVQNLPSDYHFDRTGLSKDLQDRIPSHLREEYSIANRNPMLAGLAFGEHPVPTPEANRASAILLALPFLRFRECIEEMRTCGRLTGELIKGILQEREVRRVSALQTHAKHAGDGQGHLDAMKELGYREFAVHIQTVEYPLGTDMEVVRHEYTLHREWRGYQPESSLQSVIREFWE